MYIGCICASAHSTRIHRDKFSRPHAPSTSFNHLHLCFNICSKCSVWTQEIKEYQRPKPILHVWTVNTYNQHRLLIFKDLVWDNVRSIHGICVYIGIVWNPHNCSGPVCRVKLELGATQNTSLMYTVPMLDLLRNYLSHCSTNSTVCVFLLQYVYHNFQELAKLQLYVQLHTFPAVKVVAPNYLSVWL